MVDCLTYFTSYNIISSTFYLWFGLLGILTNNSFLNDINSNIFLIGVGSIFEFGWGYKIKNIPLILGISLVLIKNSSELFKYLSGEIFDESDRVSGLNGEKFYRLPISFLTLFIYGYVSISIYLDLSYLILILFMLNWLITLISIIKVFPIGTDHYTMTRKLLYILTWCTVFGCIGTLTINICPTQNMLWIRLILGYPISNICFPYIIYTCGQLTLLLRGKNLSRITAIRGSGIMCISYYVSRFK